MGIVKKQSLQSTILSYSGVVIGFFNAIILYPRILTPDQYGLTELMLSVAIIGAEFSMIGIPNIFLRYLPYYSLDKEKLPGFLSLALTLPIIGFLFLTLTGLVFKDQIIAAYAENSRLFVDHFYLVIPLIFVLVIFQMLTSYSIASMKTVMPVLLRDLFIKGYRTGIVLVFATGIISFQVFLYLFIGGYALQALLIFGYLVWLKKIIFKLKIGFYFTPQGGQILIFGLVNFIGGTILMLIGYIDTIMLGSLKGLSEAAIYRVGFYMANVIDIPGRAILGISVPIIGAAWKVNDILKISEVYEKTALNQVIIGGLLFIGIWINIDNILTFLPEAFSSGKYVVLFILLGKLFDLATGVNGSIIGLSKDYKYLMYFNVLLVIIAIVTNLILIPLYGIVGAAIATALSVFINNAGKYLFVLYRFNLQPFSLSMLKGIMIIICCFVIGMLIPSFSNVFLDIFVRSTIVSIIFVSAILYFRVSEDISDMVWKLFERLKIK